MVDKSDPEAKLGRANQHIDLLAELVDEFRLRAYTIDAQPDFWTEPSPPACGDVIITAIATQPPPATLWGPIIGDIVHGLRSALDQLAWSLSVGFQANKGMAPTADPIPKGDPWREVWFPVAVKPSQWAQVPVKQLGLIDPNLLASIEALQPFKTGQNAPNREPLAVLQELWNIDKHRHLHLVNMTIELGDVVSVNPFPDVEDTEGLLTLDFEIVSKRAPGPLVGSTEVGRARHIPRLGGILAVSLPQMHMNPRFAVDVAFDQGAPAYGAPLLHTLREISETVEAVIAAV